MPTQQQKIIQKAKEILEKSPQGIRYSELVNYDPLIHLKIIYTYSRNIMYSQNNSLVSVSNILRYLFT